MDGVRNHIVIAGEQLSDAELFENLANKLRYDRVGYGIVFNNLNVSVENGAVTVGGKVRDYPDRSSAIAIVETTPGVKDVVDEIDVTPASPLDDAACSIGSRHLRPSHVAAVRNPIRQPPFVS